MNAYRQKVVGAPRSLVFSKNSSKLDASIVYFNSLNNKICQNPRFIKSREYFHKNPILFPEKKLIEFDSGKLNILAQILNRIRSAHQKVIIFTQMSKMLDIL